MACKSNDWQCINQWMWLVTTKFYLEKQKLDGLGSWAIICPHLCYIIAKVGLTKLRAPFIHLLKTFHWSPNATKIKSETLNMVISSFVICPSLLLFRPFPSSTFCPFITCSLCFNFSQLLHILEYIVNLFISVLVHIWIPLPPNAPSPHLFNTLAFFPKIQIKFHCLCEVSHSTTWGK